MPTSEVNRITPVFVAAMGEATVESSWAAMQGLRFELNVFDLQSSRDLGLCGSIVWWWQWWL